MVYMLGLAEEMRIANPMGVTVHLNQALGSLQPHKDRTMEKLQAAEAFTLLEHWARAM